MTQSELQLRTAEIGTLLGLMEKDSQRKLDALKLGIEMTGGQFELERGIAETGFKARIEEMEALRKAPAETLEMEKTRAEIERLRRPEKAIAPEKEAISAIEDWANLIRAGQATI